MLFFSRLLLAVSLLATTAHAQQTSTADLVIGEARSRPTSEGMPIGVAYLTVTNRGTQPDTLVAARTPAAARVEFHRTTIEDGMAKMRAASSLVIAAGTTLRAEPGGLHLMLIDLKAPLVAGTTVPLILTFKSAGEITVQLRVADR